MSSQTIDGGRRLEETRFYSSSFGQAFTRKLKVIANVVQIVDLWPLI